MSDLTRRPPLDPEPSARAPTPLWKRRWRRIPFWALAGGVIVAVGVVGALAEGDGPGGGAAVADLDQLSAPASPATTAHPTSTSSDTAIVTSTVTVTTPTSAAPTTPATAATRLVPVPVPVAAEWTITSVIDGDTIDDAGPEGALTVRLIGINTPENNECWADEATAALSSLVAGEQLTVVRDTSDTDQYGRALRYVETGGGVDVGAALVESGHAIARRYEPDTARSDRYDELQRQASDAGLGLWAAAACGAPVAGVSITVEIRADAAGDDNFNLNDEWVRFTNAGTAAVDLDGWVIADESASHRYGFVDFVLDPGRAVTLFTGCGSDTPEARYWCNTNSAVWNNSGDTVFLRDPSGNNVVVQGYWSSADQLVDASTTTVSSTAAVDPGTTSSACSLRSTDLASSSSAYSDSDSPMLAARALSLR